MHESSGVATPVTDWRHSEIAAERPASVRVFEKYDIDYCCGGKISLAAACAGRGIAPKRLIEELVAAVKRHPQARLPIGRPPACRT